MMMIDRSIFVVFWLIWLPIQAHATTWQPAETTRHYTITGSTGPALYASIGERGPEPSVGVRAIAYTSWDLKWRRDYQPRNGGCELASALPFLTITYTLPKPAERLTGATAENWKLFSDGMVEHEHFHGVLLRQMTDRIIADTVGLRTDNDLNCQKIRARVLEKVKTAFEDYSRQSAEFDRVEMSTGGHVHGLILQLVNGG